MSIWMAITGIVSYYAVLGFVRIYKKHAITPVYLTAFLLPLITPAVYFFGKGAWQIILYLLLVVAMASLIFKVMCFLGGHANRST